MKCGTGYHTNLMQAQIADQASGQTDLADQCQNALMLRRAWAIPIALAGWVLFSGVAVALWRHTSQHAESVRALR